MNEMGRKKGSTNVSVELFFLDSTTGAKDSGVDSNTAGLEIWYRRQGGNKVVLASVNDLLALTDAHNDEGLLLISNGLYRLDMPDAAWATGAEAVTYGGSATGLIALGGTIPLLEYDPYTINLEAIQTTINSILTETDTNLPALIAMINAAKAESYVPHGNPATPAQLLWSIYAMLTNLAKSGTLLTAKKQDGSTAFTLTTDHPTNPTSVVRNP